MAKKITHTYLILVGDEELLIDTPIDSLSELLRVSLTEIEHHSYFLFEDLFINCANLKAVIKVTADGYYGGEPITTLAKEKNEIQKKNLIAIAEQERKKEIKDYYSAALDYIVDNPHPDHAIYEAGKMFDIEFDEDKKFKFEQPENSISDDIHNSSYNFCGKCGLREDIPGDLVRGLRKNEKGAVDVRKGETIRQAVERNTIYWCQKCVDAFDGNEYHFDTKKKIKRNDDETVN